jgi:hypothetical protein
MTMATIEIEEHGPKPRFTMLMMSGMLIDILDPKPETILAEDIAQCLGNEARFCGNIDYVVLAHSLVVAELTLSQMTRENPDLNEHDEKLIFRCGLLHDATETYCRDLPRDLKRAMECLDVVPHDVRRVLEEFALGYRAAETRFMNAIRGAFSLRFAHQALEEETWRCVKLADDDALAAEVRLFWPQTLRGHFSVGAPTAPALRHTEQYGSLPKAALRETFLKALHWSLS